ncbi:MAG TPA: hypothetical protein VK943_17985 [Arenibaculum sp.]|nr:hypothetical protein [Arenibaculum sp.]
MATRRLDREDHVKLHLAGMLEEWRQRTGRDMSAAAADRRLQQCTTMLIDLLGDAEKVDEAADRTEDNGD